MNGTVGEAVRASAARLAAAGVPSPRFEARLLLAHVLGAPPARLLAHPERAVDDADAGRYAGLVQRRTAGEPFAYLCGEREFWSLSFKVTPATLIPRPETETVVEAVLEAFPDRQAPLTILDLGTGSGCLLLALLHERPQAWGVGVDISAAALAVASANAFALGLAARAAFVAGDWADAIGGRFDVIVANPPYIETEALVALPVDVREFEPRLALDGGPDGLGAYRQIADSLVRVLSAGGAVFFESGEGQEGSIAALLQEAGTVQRVESKKDLRGVRRVVGAWSNTAAPGKKPLGNQAVPV